MPRGPRIAETTSDADDLQIASPPPAKKSSKGEEVTQPPDDQVSSGSASDFSSEIDDAPPPKTGKKRKSDSQIDTSVKSKKSKKSASDAIFKSKAYIDDDDNPVSSPPPGIDEAAPAKGTRKTSTSEQPAKPKKPSSVEGVAKTKNDKGKKTKGPNDAQYGGSEAQESEIRKLKELVNACGAKVPQKQLADFDAAEVITRLTTQLTTLGLKKPFSLSKAKALRTERELAREVADIGGSKRIDTDAARASRSTGSSKPMWLPKGAASDGEESDEVVREAVEKDFERKEKVKDRRAERNVMGFVGILEATGEL